MSYGPFGRLLWTIAFGLIAVWPMWQAITVGWVWVVLYLGGVPLLFVIYPLILRDVWKKVRNPDYAPPIVLPPETGPMQPGESLHDRKMPRRW